ncbi:MAG: prephenate dehydrogenase [Myxococcota bacterium]
MTAKAARPRRAKPRKAARAGSQPSWRRVAIVGVGLIGGSLALALRRKGMAKEIVGVGRSAANLALARRRRMVSRVTSDPALGVEGADLVVLAAPVGALPELAKTIAPALAPGAIVTDVGSVKEQLVPALEAIMPPRAFFVGAHPIAGGEESGAGAARPDLFEGRRCVLTPTPDTNQAALAKVRKTWKAVGADVVVMDAAEHDNVLATVSHLPHVIAFAVVNAVAAGAPEALRFAGSGFRDFTRIAASHPEMWRDIVLANRERIQAALAATVAELQNLREVIERQDADRLAETFTRARDTRRSLDRRGGGGRAAGKQEKPARKRRR